MPNVLIVTLDSETNPTCLNVEEKGNPNHVKRDADWQTIRWKLEVKDPKASFNPLTDTKNPGFVWVGSSSPPAGVFSEPSLRKHGLVLTIADLNDYDPDSGDPSSANTTGDWEYQLNATIGGKPYQAKAISGVLNTTNPRIKNT